MYNFYSIYHILEELAKKKKVTHEFKEILYEHSFNEKKEKELAVKDNFDMFFLHFFKKIDLNSIPCEYPCSCEYLNDSKVKEKIWEHLGTILFLSIWTSQNSEKCSEQCVS